jgi:hypothetical protein
MRVFNATCARAFVFTIACVLANISNAAVAAWDTMKGSPDQWRRVPSNLMELEKDPLKAASDPGYYGREYEFTGNVIVRNDRISAYFPKGHSKVILYRFNNQAGEHKKSAAELASPLTDPKTCYGQIAMTTTNAITGFELIRNAADEVVIRVEYGKDAAVTYTFGSDEIIEVKTSGAATNVRFESSIEYAIAPAFVGDDVILKTEDAETDLLTIPAENILLGLIQGGNRAVVITWPGKGKATLTKKDFRDVEIETSGDPIFIAALAAPGIWHREALTVEHLEKDVAINWKPPFPAKWQTQLIEGAVKTTFAFRDTKGTVWRGVPGSYNYPAWFDGDKPMFSLSKKVPPKGEAIIYFLEGHDTPHGALTPVDVLKSTLGRREAAAILDVEGRRLRTHHGESGSNVHRACTCGYTEAIQAVFEKGEECDKKDFVAQSLDDMIYFVRQHVARIDEYRKFAGEMSEYLQAKAKSNPELKEYLEDLDATVQQIPAEYENQKENMKSLEHAAELQKMTLALTATKKADNLKQYMELLKVWRAMGGAQDYVVAQYHTLARKLFQEASYNAASNPKAAEAAREIRAKCKQILRNPDGYEIWANY